MMFDQNTQDLLLALNGTEETLQIVLAKKDKEDSNFKMFESRSLIVPGRSASYMIPAIKNSLDMFEIEANHISHIALSSGPGSFTGLRLTFAAASGIMCAGNSKIAPISYLALLALGASKSYHQPVWVITHSRRMQVYIQGFHSLCSKDSFPSPMTPPLPVSVNEAISIINSYKQDKAVIAGSGIHKNITSFAPLFESQTNFTVLDERFNTPTSNDLLTFANHATYTKSHPLPEYLRGSDAEENLEYITSKRGINLEDAKKILSTIYKN